MSRLPLYNLALEEARQQKDTHLKSKALDAYKRIQSRILSRHVWISNREKEIKILGELSEKLELAYQRGNLHEIHDISHEINQYSTTKASTDMVNNPEYAGNGYSLYIGDGVIKRVTVNGIEYFRS